MKIYLEDLKDKKIASLIVILICVITLTFCTNTEKQTQSIYDKPQSIVLYIGEKQISINDETDVLNVYTLIQAMETSSQSNDIEQGIKGEFIFGDNTKQNVSFGENRIIVDGKSYEGANQCISIMNILNKHIYDKKYLIEAVNAADIIRLTAGDMSKDVLFAEKEKNQLIAALTSSEITYADFLDMPIVPDFPEYSLQLGKESIHKTIKIINPDLIYVIGDTIETYSTGEELWNMASSLITPQKDSDLSKPAYLFNAEKVEINDGLKYGLGSGDYTKRLLWIVRMLKDSEAGINSSQEGDKLTLTFMIENEIYEVKVYKDGFIYNNEFYAKPSILEEMKSMLLAG